MKARSAFIALLNVVTFAALLPAQTQTPQQTLPQYVADLQHNPGDDALRQKIIALVQTMLFFLFIRVDASCKFFM